MRAEQTKSILDYFEDIEDPRMDRTKKHSLMDILVISICAILCGADDFSSIEEFCKARESWFKSFLKLPNGIPSHDTFGRVFSLLEPAKLEACFLQWLRATIKVVKGEMVSIDGKTMCGSSGRLDTGSAVHMVSAYASEAGMVLGQVATDRKSNEITAIPELLEHLLLEGCIVTIDAMGCQKKIAQAIVCKGADYVLALKGNQGALYEDVKLFFDDGLDNGFSEEYKIQSYKTVEKGHGRIEKRHYFICSKIDWLEQQSQWPGFRSIGMVCSSGTRNGKQTQETRYYISSMEDNPKEFGKAVRSHWGIENRVHWVLDVAFREDSHQLRNKTAAENLSVVRRIALNLLKQEKTAKVGVKNKRLKAGWSQTYLLKVLGLT